MKKLLALLFMVSCVTTDVAMGATIAIKKAAPVATQKQDIKQDGASLIGTVLTMVSGVKDLTTKQKQLTEECIPSGSDVSFVNELVKEWAKAGGGSKSNFASALNANGPCARDGDWVDDVEDYGGPDEIPNPCYENFNSTSDKGAIWEEYPKAVVVRYCPDTGGDECKNKATVTNLYDIINMIDFGPQDFTIEETTRIEKLTQKIEHCSNAKISARKAALWSEFLNTTISGVGQKHDMSNVLNAVTQVTGSMGNGGGFGGALQSLGGIATQFIPQ